MRDALGAQHQLEIRIGEGAVAGFVDNDVLRRDIDLRNDLEARARAQQDVGAVEAGALAAPFLIGRHVGHVSPIALSGVDDRDAGLARG